MKKTNLFLINLPVLFAVFVIVFLVYANTLQSPFTFDDQQIADNYFITHFDLSWEGLKKVASLSPNKRRVLPNISFALNYYLDGSNVWGYHLVNIIIHITVAFVFYLLASTTLALPVNAKRLQRTGEVAFMAALIWAVHPLQTNAVTYIVQRMTSMATLFFLLSLLCYVKGRIHNQFDLKKTALFSAATLFGIMALLSKENSGMLPVVILGYEFFFLRQPQTTLLNRKKVLFFCGGGLIVFLVICWIFLGSDPLASLLGGYSRRDFTVGQRLLTETRVIFHYLTLLVLPLPSRLNLAYDYQLSTGFFSPPQTLLAIIGLITLVGLVFSFYKRDRLMGFAIFWFLVNLIIESSVISLELIFEHRMYMPSMFLVLALVAWGYKMIPLRINSVRVVIIALLATFSFFTWQRNAVWQNEINLWTDVINKSPGLVRAYVNLGNAYGKIGMNKEAESYLLKAIGIDPNDEYPYLNLATSLEKQHKYAEAIKIYKKAQTLKNLDPPKLHSNLSVAYLKTGDFDSAIEHASKSMKLYPYRYNPYATLGIAYFKIQAYQQAEQIFQQAIKIFPEKGALYIGLGSVYENQNKLSQAVTFFNKALTKKDTNKAKAYNNLGIVYWRMGDFPQSVTAAQKAIVLDPELLDAYLTLGITYEAMGLQSLAFEQFSRAWQKGLDMIQIYNEWAVNFMKRNDLNRAILYLQEAVRLAPRRPESHSNLSKAYQLKGMTQEAKTHEDLYRQLKNQ